MLTELLQILFKHIETAPKDILGRFPRMSRDEAQFKINCTQKNLGVRYQKDGHDNGNSKSVIPSLLDIKFSTPPPELMQDHGIYLNFLMCTLIKVIREWFLGFCVLGTIFHALVEFETKINLAICFKTKRLA